RGSGSTKAYAGSRSPPRRPSARLRARCADPGRAGRPPPSKARPRTTDPRTSRRTLRPGGGPRRAPAWQLGRVETWRLANAQGSSWIPQGFEHLFHAGDLGRLIDLYVRGEAERILVLRGAVRREQRADHRDRAFMVLDHVLQEQAVELRPACRLQLPDLLRREHAGHRRSVAVLHAVDHDARFSHVHLRDRLAAVL